MILVDGPSPLASWLPIIDALIARFTVYALDRSGREMAPAFDLSAELPGVETPTRFVWGTEDYCWPPSVARPVASAMPDPDLVVLEGHGHTPWLEPGDEAVETALAFLAEE